MRDMTVGQPRQHLWRHALPMLLGNWMQLSYNAVDSIIAGRFIGKEALAAEGIAAPVMNLVILAISGVCIGAGILMSEAFGAKDRDKFSRVLANTVLSGLMVCCVIAGLGMALTPQILQGLEVPEQIHTITVTYLRITFLGAPFTFCYNALSAGLKSVGDAKTPLKFLAFSSILNAVLDLIFLLCCIPVFTIGAASTAMYTVIFDKENESSQVGRFFRAFIANFKTSTKAWLVCMVVFGVLAVDLLWLNNLEIFGQAVFRFIIWGFIIYAFAAQMYLFPLLSKYDAPLKNTLKNSMLLCLGFFPSTLVMLIINLAPVLLFFMNIELFFRGLPLIVMFWFAITAHLDAIMLRSIFRKVENANEEAEEEQAALPDKT